MFINRFLRKKKATAAFLSASRLFLPFLILAPSLPVGTGATVFIVLMSALNFFDAVGQNSIQGILGSVFDGKERARAIAARVKFGNVALLAVTIATGLIITLIPKNNAQTITLYQIFFAGAFIVGVAEIFVFYKFREKDPPVKPEKTSLKLVVSPLRDKKFLKFMFPTIIFYFFWHIGWPIGGIFQVKTLLADEMGFALLAVSSGLAAAISSGFWGRFINKRGNDLTLLIGFIGVAVNMLLLALCPNMPVMILINAFGGAFTSCVSTALLNGLLEATPDKNRVLYIGVYNTFVNISMALSPFAAYWLNNAISTRPTMALIGALRFIPVLLLLHKTRERLSLKRLRK